MLKIELKTTYRHFSKIFLDDSTMEKSILKVPGSIYKENHGFQGIRKSQNQGGYPPLIYPLIRRADAPWPPT